MVQEQNEIRQYIAEKRREIGSDLDALTREFNERITMATSWQRPLRERPAWIILAGLLGGLALGWVLGD